MQSLESCLSCKNFFSYRCTQYPKALTRMRKAACGKKNIAEQVPVYLIAVFRLDIGAHRKNRFWYYQAYLVTKVKDGWLQHTVDTQSCKSVFERQQRGKEQFCLKEKNRSFEFNVYGITFFLSRQARVSNKYLRQEQRGVNPGRLEGKRAGGFYFSNSQRSKLCSQELRRGQDGYSSSCKAFQADL